MHLSYLSKSIKKSRLFWLTTCILLACGGGTSGMFKGQGTGRPLPPNEVKVAESKASVADVQYTELGVARGRAATAEQAVEQAKFHCARAGGGNLLILNTAPFVSDNSWRIDATCALRKGTAQARSNGRQPK